MQAPKNLIVIFVALFLASCSFLGGESFDEKIEKSRDTSRDKVNDVGEGLPFFHLGTLNPTWDKTDGIVQLTAPMSFQDQDGESRDESTFQDKITIAAFFFTSCSGFCPVLIRGLKEVEEKLKLNPSVQFVALSVDPEVDTPNQLKKYAGNLKLDTDKNWTLLTGEKKLIYSIAKKTLSSEVFKKQTSNTRNFIHSENFYFFDKEARLRGVLKGTRVDTPDEAQKLVAQLLAPTG